MSAFVLPVFDEPFLPNAEALEEGEIEEGEIEESTSISSLSPVRSLEGSRWFDEEEEEKEENSMPTLRQLTRERKSIMKHFSINPSITKTTKKRVRFAATVDVRHIPKCSKVDLVASRQPFWMV